MLDVRLTHSLREWKTTRIRRRAAFDRAPRRRENRIPWGKTEEVKLIPLRYPLFIGTHGIRINAGVNDTPGGCQSRVRPSAAAARELNPMGKNRGSQTDTLAVSLFCCAWDSDKRGRGVRLLSRAVKFVRRCGQVKSACRALPRSFARHPAALSFWSGAPPRSFASLQDDKGGAEGGSQGRGAKNLAAGFLTGDITEGACRG